MASEGKGKESGSFSSPIPVKIPSFNLLFKERLKNLVTKAAVKELRKNLDSDSESQSTNREAMKTINGPGNLDEARKEANGANGTGSRSRNRSGSIDSGSSELSFSSKNSNGEEEVLEQEEGGYVLCLIVLTALLNKKELSGNKSMLFRAMQQELAQSLKSFFPDLDAGVGAERVFEKIGGGLVEALTPVLDLEITELDCRKALELLEAGNEAEAEQDCYDRNYLKNLRRGGFIQYFCDIVTIFKTF
jgi:hypothetical protein